MSVQEFRITKDNGFGKIALGIGCAALAASVAGLMTNRAEFFHAYLVAYCFWLGISLGSLFFTMLHHIVSADWSTVFRRISESLMITMPVMAILFIPIGLGIHDLYHWSHAEAVAADKILQHKAGWLNTGFFLVRAFIYFAIWTALAYSLYKTSLEQDKRYDEKHRATFKAISAPGILLFALSLTFAAWDWVMSLDPHWYSTIFGIYMFAGAWWATLAFIVFFSLYLRANGVLASEIKVDHYHDMGKLMFGFTVFWAYIAFSQFMLIWYGNIEEETIFYKRRWEHGWEYVSIFLGIGHFAIPFFPLLLRAAKRNLTFMRIISAWMLFMHFVDLFWLIMPNLGAHGEQHAAHGVHISWMHLTTFLGIGGIFLWFFWQRLTSAPLLPIGDARLKLSLEFHQ